MSHPLANKKGQSMVEILIAVSVGALIIGSATGAIVLTLRINTQNRATQTANSLGQELIDNVRSLSEASWTNLYNVASKGPATNYYLINTSGADFTVVSGKEGVLENEIRDGLVGQWKFDESSGTTVYDSSGTGNNGTVTGTSVTTGFIANARNFIASTDKIVTPSTSILNTDTHTIAFWINFTATPPAVWTRIMAYRPTGTDRSPGIWINPSNLCIHWRYDPLNTGPTACGGPNGESTYFNLNTWYHIAGVKSGATFNFYVNGSQTESGSVANPKTAGNAAVELGQAGENSGFFSIDDLRIYNRILSTTEVFQIYNSRPFTRYLSVENVNRDSGGSIVTSGGTEDPSTQKVTATVSWNQQGGSTQIQATEFLARTKDEITQFTNWNGGSGVEGPVTTPNAGYSSQTGVDLTTTPGSIQVIAP